jgi:hypothetical protein
MFMPSKFFIRLGGTAWIVLIGLASLGLIATWLEFLPVKFFHTWRGWVLVLGGGGLACFFIAWILSLWEKW